MTEQQVQVVDIDADFVIPSIAPRDVLGNPIVREEEPEVPNIANEIASIEQEDSSLTDQDEPATDADNADEGADDGSTTEFPDIEEQPSGTQSNTVLRDYLKAKYGDDFSVIVSEDGEDVEVSIDEIEVDPETFATIIEAQKEAEKEEALKDKISISGLDSFSKNLIEVSRRGGSVTHLLEYKEAYLDPLQGIDMDTEEGQKQVLELYYKAKQAPGEEAEDTELLIETFAAKGVLEDRALKAKEAILKAVEAQAENAKKQAIALEEQRQEQMKEYTKSLKGVVQTRFGFNDTKTKKLIDSATKVNPESKRVALIDLYQGMMSNPDTAAELILFLNDKEEYIKQATKEAVITDKIKTASRIGVIKVGSKVEVRKKQKSDEDTIVPFTIASK